MSDSIRFGDLYAQPVSDGSWQVSIGDTNAALGRVMPFGIWFAAIRGSDAPAEPPLLIGWAPSLADAVALFG